MICVGIDPDSEKSGVCYIELESGVLRFEKYNFFDLIGEIGTFDPQGYFVGLEGGFLSEAIWHRPKWANERTNINSISAYMAKVGEGVGRCNQTALLIKDFCERMSIPIEIVKPQKKVWRNGKISTQEIEQLEGVKLGRLNQDQRDAYIIADVARRMYKLRHNKL